MRGLVGPPHRAAAEAAGLRGELALVRVLLPGGALELHLAGMQHAGRQSRQMADPAEGPELPKTLQYLARRSSDAEDTRKREKKEKKRKRDKENAKSSSRSRDRGETEEEKEKRRSAGCGEFGVRRNGADDLQWIGL